MPTFRTWTRSKLRPKGRDPGEQGFSLIEMLIVVALMAVIALVAAPSISSVLRISLNSATRELASVIKEAYNSAVVTGRVHRVAYDLRKQQYWVERGPATLLLDTTESKEREERRKRIAGSKADDKPPPSGFGIDKTITRSKKDLPRGVTFEDILTQQSPEPITEGVVYTHIFPHGLSEQTIIHLTDTGKKRISLVIAPLVGKTELHERYVTAEEIFAKR
jgi:prepilin-type N-terminal cleavage/methylation domain-containing protein